MQCIDPQVLIGEIFAEMQSVEDAMTKTGSVDTREETPGLLEAINTLHIHTISDINKLIDYAKQIHVTRNPQPEPTDNDPRNRREPREPGEENSGHADNSSAASYEPASDGSNPNDVCNRTAVDTDRWGDLPAKKRDAAIRSGEAGPVNKYSHELEEYRDAIAKKSKEK